MKNNERFGITDSIPPGSTIGILGAGQLGKMSLVAAHQLGYHSMVWAPQGDNPAMEMATHRLIRPFTCKDTLAEVLNKADVITTEWENIPLSLIEALEYRGGKVCPGSNVLSIAQSRIKEKNMARKINIPTAKTAWLPTQGKWDEDWKLCLPGILKTNTLGYDGKGQWRVTTEEEVIAAYTAAQENKPTDCVLEKRIDLRTELSILVARSASEEISLSDVVENTHKNGILDTTIWPTSVSNSIIETIKDMADRIARYLALEGILALEFFVDREGNVLFNEMAPRPHNSFHGSIEAAYTSQFEQHIRAICNLELGRVTFHTPFQMTNLIGGAWQPDWAPALTDPYTRLHLYGKTESRPGRKMGHITTLKPR